MVVLLPNRWSLRSWPKRLPSGASVRRARGATSSTVYASATACECPRDARVAGVTGNRDRPERVRFRNGDDLALSAMWTPIREPQSEPRVLDAHPGRLPSGEADRARRAVSPARRAGPRAGPRHRHRSRDEALAAGGHEFRRRHFPSREPPGRATARPTNRASPATAPAAALPDELRPPGADRAAGRARCRAQRMARRGVRDRRATLGSRYG